MNYDTAVRITGTALGAVNFTGDEVGAVVKRPAADYGLEGNNLGDRHLECYSEAQEEISIEFVLWRRSTLSNLQSIAAAIEDLTVYPYYQRDATASFVCVLVNPGAVGEITVFSQKLAGHSITLRFMEQVTP